jgi:ribosomal protein S18 acetylase RimI-like enzyme
MSDFHIRPAVLSDADSIGRVHVAVWRQAYAGIMPAGYLAALSAAERAAMWRKMLQAKAGAGGESATVLLVAEDAAAGIVGFALGGRERGGTRAFDGELWAINIDSAWHGRGLGRRLVLEVARGLAGRGQRGMLLWVMEANRPARRFYERLGAVRLPETKLSPIGGASLTELAYGWPSLPALIARLEAETAAPARRRA